MPRGGDRHHGGAVGDRPGPAEAHDRFPPDEQRDYDQGHGGVGQRRKDADAMIAKGHALVGRLAGDPDGVPS